MICLFLLKKSWKEIYWKWHNKLKIQYTLDIWSIVCNIPDKCTIDTKLWWFQFRLIHRILGVNSFLLKINKADSGLCSFCNLEEETNFTFFCVCPITLLFWNNVAQWLRCVEVHTCFEYCNSSSTNYPSKYQTCPTFVLCPFLYFSYTVFFFTLVSDLESPTYKFV